MRSLLVAAILSAGPLAAQPSADRDAEFAQSITEIAARFAPKPSEPRALTPEEYDAIMKRVGAAIPQGQTQVTFKGRTSGEYAEPCSVEIKSDPAKGALSVVSETNGSYLDGITIHPGRGSGEIVDLVLSVRNDENELEILKPLYQANRRIRLGFSGGRLSSYGVSYPSKDPKYDKDDEPQIVCRFER